MVKGSSDGVAASLRELGHAGAFGNVLTDEAVGVFVGAALPGMMGSSEVKRGTGSSLDQGVIMELGAVVGGDGFESLRMSAYETQSA